MTRMRMVTTSGRRSLADRVGLGAHAPAYVGRESGTHCQTIFMYLACLVESKMVALATMSDARCGAERCERECERSF
jgi:hypothetical protein